MPKARLSRKAAHKRRLLRRKPHARKQAARARDVDCLPALAPDELAMLMWIGEAISGFEYEVLGAPEPTWMGALLGCAVQDQLCAVGAGKREWLKLDVDRILDSQSDLNAQAQVELFSSLYAFITWLHRNESLPGPVAAAMQARMDLRQPPEISALRATLAEQLARGIDPETLAILEAQEARHAERQRRRRMN